MKTHTHGEVPGAYTDFRVGEFGVGLPSENKCTCSRVLRALSASAASYSIHLATSHTRIACPPVLCASSRPTSCDSMNCSPPGSSVHGILQARILEWVAMPSSRGSSQPRDRTQVSHFVGGFFTVWATREAWITAWVKIIGNNTSQWEGNYLRLLRPLAKGKQTQVQVWFIHSGHHTGHPWDQATLRFDTKDM